MILPIDIPQSAILRASQIKISRIFDVEAPKAFIIPINDFFPI